MIILASAFALFLGISHHTGYLPASLLIGYGVMSAISFFLYGLDKLAAINGHRRIPETRLHLFSLLGGWPGAAVAQAVFRHKRSKVSFMHLYRWLSTANACLLIGWLISN